MRRYQGKPTLVSLHVFDQSPGQRNGGGAHVHHLVEAQLFEGQMNDVRMNAGVELRVKHRGGHRHLVSKAGGIRHCIGDRNDGPGRADRYAGAAVHAQLLGYDRLAPSHPDGLGGAVAHAGHVPATFIQNHFVSVIELHQSILPLLSDPTCDV